MLMYSICNCSRNSHTAKVCSCRADAAVVSRMYRVNARISIRLFKRSSDTDAKPGYRHLFRPCAFFLVWGYFIIALPVLPPCSIFYKPTGLMISKFSFRYRPPPCHHSGWFLRFSTLYTLIIMHHPATVSCICESVPCPLVAAVIVGKGGLWPASTQIQRMVNFGKRWADQTKSTKRIRHPCEKSGKEW